jgi:hypothetical protein
VGAFGADRFDKTDKTLRRFLTITLLALAMASRPAIAGDRVGELTTQLASSSEKTRLQATLSLARLRDKRAVKPLLTALQDPNAQVRTVAANALGKLGNKTTLAQLKSAATDDVDETVRKTAREAVAAIAKVNNIQDDLPPAADQTAGAAPAATAGVQARTAPRTTGFGRSPHAVVDRPDLYVMVKGCNDDSPGKSDKATRKLNADVLKASLTSSLSTARQVTMVKDDAERWGLDGRTLDVSVVKLEISESGNYVEVASELRLAISDSNGKLISFLAGGAKVQVPKSKYKPQFVANMRKEAIEGALSGLFDKLLVHLRQITTT